MPLNTLLLTCLIPGTSFGESGGRVSVNPAPGETVLFFSIDDQTNPNCALRKNLKIKGAICDLIVFYTHRERKILCLVELKGKNANRAVEQIVNVFQTLQTRFNPRRFPELDWKACIYLHGAAPKQTKQLAASLEKSFGKGDVSLTRKSDIGDFLRR